jgi:predicted PurR-regulated permease PerM
VALFVGIIVASTFRPLLTLATRAKIPAAIAIFLIYLFATVAIIGLLLFVVPPVITLVFELSRTNELVRELNGALIRIWVILRQQFEVYVPIFTLPPEIQEFLETADETVAEQAWPFARSAAYILSQLVLAIVISVYWLVARGSALRQLVRLTSPQYRRMVYRIWTDTEDILGGFVRGQVLLAFIVGGAALAGLTALQVPNALALAVLAGMFEVVPFIGPVAATVPAALMALTVNPLTAVAVLVWYMVIQQVENNYLVPHIMGRGLRLHPLTVLLAIVAGLTLNGVVGAMLALPLAGALQVTIRHLREALPEDESDLDNGVSTVPASAATPDPVRPSRQVRPETPLSAALERRRPIGGASD